MKQKIYKYLIEQKRTVSSDELMEKFFRISKPHSDRMKGILTNLLKDDERIVFTEDGMWSIKKADKASLSEIMFSVIDLEAMEINPKNKVPVLIGITFVQNFKVIADEIYALHPQMNCSHEVQRRMDEIRNEYPIVGFLDDYADRFYRSINQTILVHSSSAQMASFVNDYQYRITGLDCEMETLSLMQFARRIFPKLKFRSINDVAALLNLIVSEPMNLSDRLSLNFEILELLIQKSRQEHGIETLEELKSFLIKTNRIIDFSKYKFDAHYIKNIPASPGVYVMTDHSGKVIYVGKSKNLKSRIESYFVDRFEKDDKIRKIFSTLYDIGYQKAGNELEALLMENEAIHKFNPGINIQIDIHQNSFLDTSLKNVILFLPSKVERMISLFLIKGKENAAKIDMELDKPNWKFYRKVINDFFYESSGETESIHTREQMTIIWRWITLNKDQINYLDVDQAGTIESCLKSIQKYVSDDDLFTRKITYYIS